MALTAFLPIVAAFFAYPYVSNACMAYLMKKFTFVNELQALEKPRANGGRKLKGTAVLAGGGGAGLITAVVLSKHFERVVVVEAEEWVNREEGMKYEKPEVRIVDGLKVPYTKRKRVAQFLSLHTWPTFVLQMMRQLFPRWDQDIKSDGGIIEPFISNAAYSGIPIPASDPNYPLGLPSQMYLSRNLFEPVLRRSVRTVYPQIEFVSGSVVGVHPDKLDRSRIGEVEYREVGPGGDEEGRSTKRMEVSLFVDCAGPSNLGLKWLSSAGYLHGSNNTSVKPLPKGKLPVTQLTHKYTQKFKGSTSYWPLTNALKTGTGIPRGGFLYFYFPCPGRDDRMLAIGRLEGDQILIVCGVWGDMAPSPRNLDEIRGHIDGLNPLSPLPKWIFQLLDDLREFEDEAVYEVYALPPCTRVMYSQAADLPSNFVAVGDSVLAANPVFGQGFLKICMGALILDSLLHEIPSSSTSTVLPQSFSTRFFSTQDARILNQIWVQTKTQDYAWPTTIPVLGENREDWKGKLMRWYAHNLLLASIEDKELGTTRFRVGMWMYPGVMLFTPAVWLKVIRQWLSGRIPRPPVEADLKSQ